MAAGIARVVLKNYRSIAFCDVQLKPLTVLVGPNGSGKSNFLDGLRFLVHSMNAPLEQVLEARYGIASILHKLSKGQRASSFSIEVGINLESALPCRYSIVIAEEPGGGFRIEIEECNVGRHYFRSTPLKLEHNVDSTPSFTGDRPALVAFGSMPAFAPVSLLSRGS